jgi:peptidoglycan hydrolase-like protein with peptidoglycan-binding domain
LADLIAGADPAAVNAAYSSLEAAQASLEVQRLTAAEQLATGPTFTVLMYGTAPAWRDLSTGSSMGPDITQLEANLAALGFDADGTLVADGVFDQATEIAVSAWQESLGVEPTGEVALGSVVFVEGPSLVDDQLGVLGSTVNPGNPLLSLTPTRTGEELVTTQRVVAQLPLADRSLLDIGTEVTIDLPDGTDVPATVLDIGNVPLGGGADGSEAYVEVEIQPFEPIDEVWIGADVDVEVVSELAADVLSVPVSALLALVEGGYAVEIPDGEGTRLVGVETGMFADGFVEISGVGLEAGMEVVVPR